jgi:beta-glucosidase
MTQRSWWRSVRQGAVLVVALSLGCSSASDPGGEPVASQGDALLAGTATASSVQSASYPASNAIDGNFSTRWSSQFSDPQWIQIDFGSTQSISDVTLYWQNSYAKAYQLQISNDATSWTTIATVTNGTGGTNDFPNLAVTARYVRMYGTQRATAYGYSLWEFQVQGGTGTTDGGSD